jgi:hypothetical protein
MNVPWHHLPGITLEDFLADPHATRYRDVIQNFPEAFARLLQILNDPDQQAQLMAAEATYHHAALSGVVGVVEADERIAAALASAGGTRFRQAVGVAVRMTMEALLVEDGPERPRPRREDLHPSRAIRATGDAGCSGARALSALDAVAHIGDEAERASTARELMGGLADARRAEGRVF